MLLEILIAGALMLGVVVVATAANIGLPRCCFRH